MILAICLNVETFIYENLDNWENTPTGASPLYEEDLPEWNDSDSAPWILVWASADRDSSMPDNWIKGGISDYVNGEVMSQYNVTDPGTYSFSHRFPLMTEMMVVINEDNNTKRGYCLVQITYGDPPENA